MKKNKILIFLCIAILGLLIFLPFQNKNKAFSKDSPQKNLKEIEVKKGTLKVTVLTTGTVQPQNRLEIKPPIPGRVEEILVNEGDEVKKGQLLAWMSSQERAALLDAARAKGDEIYKIWQAYYKATPIYSPIDGMVILRDVEQGQTFADQEAVFVLSDRLAVKAQVDETDLGNIKIGQDTKILLDAYPKNEIDGKVVHIAYESTTVNNVTTFLVDVVPNEATSIMRSGMTANVIFYIEEKKDLLIIPESALKYQDGASYVRIKNEDGKIEDKKIKIGDSDDENVEVLSGLNEGDIIYIEKEITQNEDNQSKSPFMPFRNRRK